ncbi:hypothetical protein ABIE18_000593 [Arthrobacter sp. 2762]
MHVMTGTHSLHAAGTVSTAGTASSAGTDSAAPGHFSRGGHPSHGASLEEPAAHRDAPATTQCACSGNCSEEHAMAASCIPLAATSTLSAPVPDSTSAVAPSYLGAAVAAGDDWTYRPGSPSPGELSISRT